MVVGKSKARYDILDVDKTSFSAFAMIHCCLVVWLFTVPAVHASKNFKRLYS